MKASSKPLCRPHVRASITLQVPPALAIELDEVARRHDSSRHGLIVQLIQQGLERLTGQTASDIASQS